ncbi:MAG: hypothetical protein ACRDJI_02635 [Actinomycetota bacterium]
MTLRRYVTVLAAVTLFVAASPALGGPDHHHGHQKPCHPTPEQRREAAAFARVTKASSAERYASPTAALADHFEPFVDTYRAVHHYINYSNYYDWRILDPERPEALVYANTYSGPKLIGVMYSMEDPGRKPPDMGGCITQWHTHPMCKSPVGYSHIWEGDCPPGWQEDGHTELMLHVWTVPMQGGPYAFHPDAKWNCWPEPQPC